MNPTQILVCVLSILGNNPQDKECIESRFAHRVAKAIAQAESESVPGSLIAAIAFHESQFDPVAVSADGMDLGLLQIRRGGAIPESMATLSDKALQNIELNIRIGASYLARMVKSCPRYPLSRYNGRPCKDSLYSRTIRQAIDLWSPAVLEPGSPRYSESKFANKIEHVDTLFVVLNCESVPWMSTKFCYRRRRVLGLV